MVCGNWPLIGRIVDAGDHIRAIYRKTKRATRAVYNRAAMCITVGDGGGGDGGGVL
jgi:hypothetical protein